ncbi:neprilysin-1-like [Haemaphysalis longicornis]
MQGDETEADGAEGDNREEEDGQQGDEEPEELPPASRNVLMQARPEVFATFEVLTLIGVALYVHQTPRPSKWPLRLHCSSLDCFNLQAELHGSMDLGTHPCDDFYQYVCGHWAEKHGSFEDQFRYLEAKVYWAANAKVRERADLYPDASKPLSTTDKVIMSYVACVEVQDKNIDVPWIIDRVLFVGKEKPGHFLVPTGGKQRSSEVLSMLITLAMDYDLDVLFEMSLAPDDGFENRSVLTVGHSASLLRWKRHRERYLTPESMARCVESFVNVMSCDCALDKGTAAAVVAIDSEVTTKMAAAGAFTTTATGRRFHLSEVPSTRARVWERIVRKNLQATVREADFEGATNEELKPPVAGKRHVSEGSASKWNLTDEDIEVYASDPKIFGLVDESLLLNPDLHVRYFVAFHVVRALVPFASHRLTRLLFSDDNVTAILLYSADVCAMAASKLTSFALASYIFQDVLSPRRVQLAQDQVEAIRNETLGSLSWLGQSGQKTAHERLSSLRSLVAWPKRLNATDAMDVYFAVLPDFRGYYVELYLDSVATLRRRERARLLLLAAGDAAKGDNGTRVADGSTMFEGLR